MRILSFFVEFFVSGLKPNTACVLLFIITIGVVIVVVVRQDLPLPGMLLPLKLSICVLHQSRKKGLIPEKPKPSSDTVAVT